MHDTAMKHGKAFFDTYLQPKQISMEILDLGGLDVNGSLRSVANPQWDYISADMVSGNGVDIVLDDPYNLPFRDERFDAVISTSCFEHDALFWLSFLEMGRVARDGGYIYLNVPSNGDFHRYPIDAWRFYPDASLALAEWSKRSGIEVTVCESFVAAPGPDNWSDFIAIFRKGSHLAMEVEPIYKSTTCSNVHFLGSSTVVNSRQSPYPLGKRPLAEQKRRRRGLWPVWSRPGNRKR